MDDNKNFWLRFARLYSPFMEKGNGQLYNQIASEVKPWLNKELTVLELACGSGQLSFRLAASAKHWEATDFSENMIAGAKKKTRPQNLYFSVQNATKLPYADESFDTVMIANALHVMPEPDKAMAEIRRVLKPGGILFAPTFVHGEGNAYNIRMMLMNLIGFKTYSKWNSDEFTSYVQRQGFLVQKCRVFGSSLTPLCCLIAAKGRR